MQKHIDICPECAKDSESISPLLDQVFRVIIDRAASLPDPPSGFEKMHVEVFKSYKREEHLRSTFTSRANALEFPLPVIKDAKTHGDVPDIGFLMDILTSSTNCRNIILTGSIGSGRKVTLKRLFVKILDNKDDIPIYISGAKISSAYSAKQRVNPSISLDDFFATYILYEATRQYQLLGERGNPVLFIPDIDYIPMFNIRMFDSLLRRLLINSRIRLVLTAHNPQVILPLLRPRFRHYYVDRLEIDRAWEVIDKLAGIKVSKEGTHISFYDGKWTFTRAKFIARLAHLGKLSPMEQISDEDLCHKVLESMLKEYQLDSKFTFAFLEQIALSIHLCKGQFLTEDRVNKELIKSEVRQRRKIPNRTAFLERLCKMEIIERHHIFFGADSVTMYGFSELFYYPYFKYRALKNNPNNAY